MSASEPGPWDIADHAAAAAIAGCIGAHSRPLLVSLAGAQGSGKSTMATRLAAGLSNRGLAAATVALDDFYLTRRERDGLARTVHPLLATRGVPGTHDIGMLLRAIEALRERTQSDGAPGEVALPSFDKSTDDRAPRAAWRSVRTPVDVILLEGWCLGARAQADSALDAPVNALERDEDSAGIWRRWVNDRLTHEYAALFERIDLRILLRAPGFDVVSEWRREQEDDLARRTGRPGMGSDALTRFVAHYERITRWMLEDQPADLIIPLDRSRTPIV